MKAALVTGGNRDYMELTAENVTECADLVRIATSKFLKEPSRLFLDLSERYGITGSTVTMRIWMSEERGRELDKETLDALDATP